MTIVNIMWTYYLLKICVNFYQGHFRGSKLLKAPILHRPPNKCLWTFLYHTLTSIHLKPWIAPRILWLVLFDYHVMTQNRSRASTTGMTDTKSHMWCKTVLSTWRSQEANPWSCPEWAKAWQVKALLKGIYSLIPYRGCSQKFQNLNFLHLFVAFLQEGHFPKGI